MSILVCGDKIVSLLCFAQNYKPRRGGSVVMETHQYGGKDKQRLPFTATSTPPAIVTHTHRVNDGDGSVCITAAGENITRFC